MDVVTVAKRDAPKSVPLSFVLPAVAGWNCVRRTRFHRRQRRLYDEGHPLGYRRGSSFGGRFPFKTAPATEMYRSSVRSAAQRSIKPPRLMSPRPTKSAGKRKRSLKYFRKTSTYFPVAMLPSKTMSQWIGSFLARRRTD